MAKEIEPIPVEKLPGKKLLDKAKNKVKTKQKENNQMKKSIIITVAVTLTVVAAFIATFIGGMKYQENLNNQVKSEAATIVKDVTVNVTPLKK